MRKVLSKSLSMILAASLAFTSVNLTAAAKTSPDDDSDILVLEEEQESELKDSLRNAVSDENHPGGVFGFYETILNSEEGDELTVSVVRQGNTDEEASVVFKAIDVSAEYKKDYTLSVEKGIFGDKDLPAADGVRPLMEEYGEIATEDDVEAVMDAESQPSDDIENELDLTEESDETEAIIIEEEAEADEAKANSEAEATADASAFLQESDNSLANLYTLQTGEAAPEHDWTEYTTEEVSEETSNVMRAGWDESRENLEALAGVTVRLSFAPGEYKKDIKIKVNDDTASESDEVVLFVLQDAENAEVGDSYNGYLNISDNDSHEELTYSVKEKNIVVSPDEYMATVTIVRSSGIDQMDFVSVGTLAIDAEPDVDYVATNTELFFAAGVTERTVEIPVISDRTKESNFWVGVTSANGTVTEDNACLVTIQKDTEEETASVKETYDFEAASEDAEFSEVPSLGVVPVYCVTIFDISADNYSGQNKGHAEGTEPYKFFPQDLDISSADYVQIEYRVMGYTKRPFFMNDDREKQVYIWLQDQNGKDIKSCYSQFFQPPAGNPGRVDSGTCLFQRGANESWNFTNAKIKFGIVGKCGTRNEDVRMYIDKITLGYPQYTLQLVPEYNHMDQYEEKQYTTIDTFDKGAKMTYQKVYLTKGDQNYTNTKALSGTVFGISKEAKGETPNSQGIYATDETVDFKGFKLIKPGADRELSDLISSGSLCIDNNFKVKYKDYIYGDGTIQLVPVFEPKKVTVTFNNDNAIVSDKADVKGCYDGFKSGAKLEATMLDTLKIKAKANEGYGITGMALQKRYWTKGDIMGYVTTESYREVENNLKSDMPNVLIAPLKTGKAAYTIWLDTPVEDDLRVVINYDKSSITLAPSPQSKNGAKNGSILYVDKAVTGDDKENGTVKQGGEIIRIEGISINKGYTFGSIPADGYHTFWKDGTLDFDGDGIVNDTNPFYKSFQNSYGNSFRYVTQLPLSKIYYNFVKGVDMSAEEEPVPIRGWLILRDKLLISGTQIEKGLNNINVYCDGVETKTKNGGFDGRKGDGYFELTSDNFFDLFTYAVTFTGSTDYGDVATMSVQNPGTNKDILVETWKDVTITDVHLFQQVEKKDKNGYEYEKIDTSSAKTGYFTGLSDGDYNYRIQMTAHHAGANLTRAEMTFYNDEGMPVSIEGTEDENNAGIFTFDFNPQQKNIKAGARAMVTFYSGTTRFLSRDVGIELRAALGVVNVVNFLAGGDAGAVVEIIGAVNTAIDMGWSGNVDKVTATSDVYDDEEGNRVIKVGIGGKVIDVKTKDEFNEAAKSAAKASKEVGKVNARIAKLEGSLENATDEEKDALREKLADARQELVKSQEKADNAREKLDDKLEGMTKPKKNKPKLGQKFTMDLGFSFLVTFGYDDAEKAWYFKNMMLTATLGAAYEVTMNYATPIGITLGIGLKLELNGSASFVVEQRFGFEDNKNYRYYISSKNKDGLNILDTDGDDPNRKLDKYGLFSVNPAITLTLSAGIAGDLLKVSVSGKASFNMVFGTNQDSAGSCTLSASIKITALIFSFKKELANKKYRLWGNTNVSSLTDAYSAQIMQALGETGDSYLYESIDGFEAEDVSYLAAGTQWYGGAYDDYAEFNAIDEGGEDAYRESFLADKIGANPEFSEVSLGKGRFAAVFLNVPSKRAGDGNNSKAAYYTYYDGKSWSNPVLLEDDNTLDQYPRIYSLGEKGAFVVWSSVNENYKDTEDKLERQNALDIHGRFVGSDGKLSKTVEVVTKTTIDPNAGETGVNISDFASDRAFGVFANDEKLVVCYEKRQYSKGSNETAEIGDMMYPVSTVIASRTYDFAKSQWAEGTETLESLPGLAALGAETAIERVDTYNANVYGQKFFDYLPKVLLIEDMEEPLGYYREGGSKTTAVKLGENDKGFLLESDATVITAGGKEIGVVAYTIDTDGDLKTLTDKELYLATYDLSDDSFSEPIILTGFEINADTGASYLPDSSCPRFVTTDSALFLTWLRNENIYALNVSNILDNEEALVKTGTVDEVTYRYIDKSSPTESAEASYQAPYSLVTGRISSDSEDSNVTGDIHGFDVETDGKYIYVVWPEAADDRPDEQQNGLTDIQMWCARTEAAADEAGAKLTDITKPVQITSAYDNNYDDIAFGVNDGKIYGLARKIPSRFITADEAREIHQDDFDEATFVPYAVWDDKGAYPVSFFVDPGSVARIKNADFIDAVAGEGAYFSFDVLNDGFDTLDATVSAKDSKGNELLDGPDQTISGLIGGDSQSIAGFLPLDLSAKDATVIITVKEQSGETQIFTISKELEADLAVHSMSVSSVDKRDIYRVRGVVENTGNAASEAGSIKLFTKKESTQRAVDRLGYPALAPGESYEIDTFINVSDEDFTVKADYVDNKTGEIIEGEGDPEATGLMVTEELMLYASYDEDDETIEMPVYEEDCDQDTGDFIKRVAYPSELKYVEAASGVTVEAVKAVTDESGNVSGKTVSIGKGLISLEVGEKVSLLTSIESSLAGRTAAVDEEENVLFTSTGAENLTYRYGFSGDAGEFDEDGKFVALKPGTGKLTVYVYPADREFRADNYIRMQDDELDGQFAFARMDEGDYINTFDDYPAAAIKEFILDVEVLAAGERVEDADTNIFEDSKGIIYRKCGKEEVAVCGIAKGKTITALTIPATIKKDGTTYKVTRIDANAFNGNTTLKSVTIGKNVTNIRSNAFSLCSALTKVKLGANVTEIGDEAFAGCITLKNLKLPANIEKISDKAFMECLSITSVTLPAKLQYLGEKAFYGCQSLKSIILKTEVLEADNLGRDVFGDIAEGATVKFSIKNEAIKKAISDALTDEEEIFKDKKGIRYKVLSEDSRTISVLGLTDAAGNKLKTLSIPATVEYKGYKYNVVTIEKNAFADNAKLTSVKLPDTLNTIKANAFSDMPKLKKLVIPESVQKIGKEAFFGCTGLNKVTVKTGNVKIEADAFTGVPDKAVFNFTATDELAKRDIILAVIGNTGQITDAKNNIYTIVVDGTIAEAGFIGTENANVKKVTVPDAINYRGLQIPVTTVTEKALINNKTVKSLSIGKNVRTIEAGAFEGCTALEKVTIKETGYIMDRAFAGCTSLKSVTLPESISYIGTGAFTGCTALKKLTLPAGVRTIDDEAFEGCTALKSVTIKSRNLQIVGFKAFYGDNAAIYKITYREKYETYKQMLIDAGVDANKIK